MLKSYTKKHGIKYMYLNVCVFLLAMSFAWTANAQIHTISGSVVSAADGQSIPSANIVESGTQNGAITNAAGEYTLNLSNPNATIVVSFVGFVTQTIEVNGRTTIDVILEEDTQLLEEVVVTAIGIERSQRALGYSVGEVDGEELRQSRETNVANALAGKVAGVAVSKPASGPAGSSRVIIRGNTSLGSNQDNQPLYVVDGVPIDNTTLGQAGMWGGTDGGDGISALNPDDIENMSVLKGPSAAALYGTRAKNGVILITTKKASPGAGLGVEFNSNTSFENLLVTTDWQTQYGQGNRGEAPTTAIEARDSNTDAWGAPLDGSMVINWDGVMRPYSAVDDQQDLFYEQGTTTTNSLALSTSSQTASVRVGLSHLDNTGIVPNSGLERTTFTLRGTANLGARLTADAKFNFVREDVVNRPRLSDSPGNANFIVNQISPNVDPRPMLGTQERPGTNEDNLELRVDENTFAQNPYFAAYNFTSADEDRRLIGFMSLNYQLNDWLSLMGRFGGDTYTTRRTSITPFGTAFNPGGGQSEQEFRITELNTDFLLMANRDLTPQIGIDASFGGNIQYREAETLTLGGSGGFSIPELELVTNQLNQSTGYALTEKQINSLYGSAEFTYNDLFFLTLTARNDWSSTLPTNNNSYFYPSISGSLVFTELFDTPDWFDFGKVRASWAEVGGDTDPYQLLLTYNLQGAAHLGQPRGGIAQGTIPLAELKPFSQVGVEFGFDVRFLDNRLGLDFTYYDQVTENQILSTSISSASGFGSSVINAGEMSNSGIELLLSTTPVRQADVRWDLDFNFAQNDNEVGALSGTQTSLVLAESRVRGNFVTADVGEAYGTIKGQKYLRASALNGDDPCEATGAIVHDADGLPLRSGDLCVLGNGTPDFVGGISNRVRYKNLTLSALVDFSFGGDLFSATNAYAYGNGLHKETLVGREAGTIVGDGVDQDGNQNTVAADVQDYYGRIGGQIGEEFVYDASFMKLREVQLSYRVPAKWLSGTPIQVATISLVGRNLALLHSNIDNVDPESNFNNTNAQGLETSGVPQVRSFGFNINVRL